ncbi:MAG: TlpA disulfide reductase family protein [Planctomycetaceae bacterium]|jgi:hypothetical protein|nr:TlpA disulfide reductase family protein [Planctomycetaceae bacterium]
MEPHLVRWHTKWSNQGLVIIEIDNGAIDSLDAVEKHVARAGIPFAVLHDAGGEVCDRFRVEAYPAAYLLDGTGRVIWEGHPLDPDAVEQRIEAAVTG